MAGMTTKDGRGVDIRPAYGNWDGFSEVVGVKKPGGECATEPGPGVLAYVDGVAAGWCSVAPRSSHRRLMHSRTIPLVDDADPWSVVCFVVRGGYRKQGLMHLLLQGAIDHVRAHGGGILEGYPGEADERMDGISAYIGTTRLFEAAGFERVQPTDSRVGGRVRWLMRLEV